MAIPEKNKLEWFHSTKYYKQSEKKLKDVMDMKEAPVAIFGKEACEDFLEQAMKFAEADEKFTLSPYATLEEREQYFEGLIPVFHV